MRTLIVFAGVLFLVCFRVLSCLKDVYLEIIPPAVQKGHNVTLFCHYDMEGAPLYSVKWYRGKHEYYRYTPSDSPQSKVFPLHGISVDNSLSNSSQVVLRDIGLNLSGLMRCEVTADAPTYKTSIANKTMTVVDSLPGKVKFWSEQSFYKAGDMLKASCTSPPSRPPSILTFLINNKTISSEFTHTRQVAEQGFLESTELNVTYLLRPDHFLHGEAAIQCVATVATMPRGSALIKITSSESDPVPEKATSATSASCSIDHHRDLLCGFLLVLLYNHR